MGIYSSDDGAMGRLAIQKGKGMKKKKSVFMVTHTTAAVPEFWCATLMHCGQDLKARDLYTLDGHPSGSVFINDFGNLLECHEVELTHLRRWEFRGEKPIQQPAPWIARFLEDQLRKIRSSGSRSSDAWKNQLKKDAVSEEIQMNSEAPAPWFKMFIEQKLDEAKLQLIVANSENAGVPSDPTGPAKGSPRDLKRLSSEDVDLANRLWLAGQSATDG